MTTIHLPEDGSKVPKRRTWCNNEINYCN